MVNDPNISYLQVGYNLFADHLLTSWDILVSKFTTGKKQQLKRLEVGSTMNFEHFLDEIGVPSETKWDLSNGPLSEALKILDTQV